MQSTDKKLDLVPPQLAAAMSHPTRVHAMGILHERAASPRQIAEEINERLSNVTYHLNQLQKLDCIELVRTERVHGGRVLERFYRCKKRVYFDDAAWEALDEKARLDLIGVSVKMIAEDIAAAMSAGTFFGNDNAHVSRSPMILDEEGWREAADLILRLTEDLFEVEARVTERCEGGEPPDVHAKVELLQFRSPRPDEAGRASRG